MPSANPPSGPLSLGIDTGGTYTDAVLFSETAGLVAKAKALTTRHDLAAGIAAAVDAVLEKAERRPSDIALVSMSTTLATNALVEGQGGRAGLVMVGFAERDLARDGLGRALGSDPAVFLPGGHDVHGNETPLDTAPLEAVLADWSEAVSAVAVCAYFAVRNPAHEIAVRELVRSATGLPVTASHELSARLGGPRRALTTLLNARLVSLIDRLIAATRGYLAERGIVAPLMVVRGDGALVPAALAGERPIETILSGPAASLVGARHLTGLDAAIVADIGGTTTDVAILEDGRPRLDADGATVGGHRTMVEAVALSTFGLGGDSEVMLEPGALEPQILLGPRRLVPLSLAAHLHGAVVAETLAAQLRRPEPDRLDGRFTMLTGVPARFAAGLSDAEERLLAKVSPAPVPLKTLVDTASRLATLDRLVARGLVHLVGFTPTDAAHALGRQATWDEEAARLGAALFARRRDGRGRPVAASPEALAERVLACLTRRSAEAILETAFAEDGMEAGEALDHPLVRRALDGWSGIARLSLSLDRPVVGLGASAPLHYAGLGQQLATECLVPADTDVANALGAVVGRVRFSASAHVGRPDEGTFRVSAGEAPRDFAGESEALDFAEECVRMAVAERAAAAGAEDPQTSVARDIRTATVDGERIFVEATVTATASGRPRIAR